MRILITGFLSPVIWDFAGRFSQHTVTVLGRAGKKPEGSKLKYYDMSVSGAGIESIFNAGRFETVIFFYTWNEFDHDIYQAEAGAMLGALAGMLKLAQTRGLHQFCLVTDGRVFGKNQLMSEAVTPVPDTPAGFLMQTAERFLEDHASKGNKTLLVRVTELYSDMCGSVFSEAVRCFKESKPLIFHAPFDAKYDLLRAEDAASFFARAFDSDFADCTVHLCSGDGYSCGYVARQLDVCLPGLKILFSGENENTNEFFGQTAREALDWVPAHNWEDEASGIIKGFDDVTEKKSWLRLLGKSVKDRLGGFAPWAELAASAGIAQFLLDMTDTYATYRFVDIRLFFVILFGSIHGITLGVSAAALACVSFALGWVADGNNPWMLLYNMDNWLPLVMYFISGALSGYMHDKTQSQTAFIENERDQSLENAQFLENVYRQACDDRNQLQEQVMRYRDSYGRIYAIAKELDSLQPEQVFLSTLYIFEDTMKNHSAALYTYSDGNNFARLAVRSQEISQSLAKSLDLRKYPQLLECIQKGVMFTNSALEPDYPVYCAPVINDGKTIALIMLWEAQFDQQSLYYQNLFNVVTGLVQSSLVRATLFFEASADRIYQSDTHILTPQAFRETLRVYQKMEQKHAANFLLLHILCGEMPDSELGEQLKKCTRSTDVAGLLEDGSCYALMAQATESDFGLIKGRFRNAGLECELVSIEEVENAGA